MVLYPDPVPPPPDAAQESPAARAPRQDRSRRTLARMVAAARRLLAEEGVAAVTVQGVVSGAGASVGSFYARFSGKEDLLQHLQQEVWKDVMRWWSEALEAVPWDRLSLEESLDRAVGLLDQSLGVMAPERHALRTRDESIAAEEAFRAGARRSLGGRILERRAAIGHPDPEAAVDLGLRAVYGVLWEEADTSSIALDRPDASRIRSELTRLFQAYLAGEPSQRGKVDFFDVWG